MMKLTGILKTKVDKAETMEAKKEIIAEAGMELTDEELESATGGTGDTSLTVKHMCENCGKTTQFYVYSGGRAVCSVCGFKTTL